MELNLHIPKSFLDLHLFDKLIQRIARVCDETAAYRYSYQNLNNMNKVILNYIEHREMHVFVV